MLPRWQSRVSDRVAAATYQQRQIWLAERSAAWAGLYNEACALDMLGPLDVPALDEALTAVVRHHEALRTTFAVDGPEPLQLVSAGIPVRLAAGARDLSQLAEDTRLPVALGIARQFAEAPFDVTTGPLFRCALIKISPSHNILVLNVHHIICDGWSLELVLDQLRDLYASICAGVKRDLGPSPPGYADFAEWQHRKIEGGVWDAQLQYWQAHLEGAPAMTELPAARPRPPVKSYKGGRDLFRFSAKSRKSLEVLRAGAFGSPVVPLIAACGMLMYRYTGRTDLVIGTAAHGRPQGYEQTVGLFANLVPVRLAVNGHMTVGSCLRNAADQFFDAIDYSAVPFEKVVDVTQPVRDSSLPPLVQVVCAVSGDSAPWSRFGELTVTRLDIPRGRARFDLLIEHELDGHAGWTAHVEYDDALFDAATIRQLMSHYQRLIDAGAENAGAGVASLAMLDEAERAGLCSGTGAVLDRDGNVLPAGAAGELTWLPGPGQMVRSGRVARRTAAGAIEELGSVRRRIRIGHLDVQLEQVEALLADHPAVRDAGVVVPPGPQARPVAYVVPPDVPVEELRTYLRERLPRVLLPADIIPATSITYGPENEPVVAPAVGAATEQAPSDRLTWLENQLLGVWRDILELGQIDRDDDFFGIGGRSITASDAAQRISDLLGIEVSVRAIFEYPTAAELAAVLAAEHPGLEAPPGREAVVTAGGTGSPTWAPMSSAQLQIWLNQQFTQDARDDFNSSFACRLRGPLDVALLRYASGRALSRHPSFGVWLEDTDDLPIARFGTGAPVQLEVADLRESGGNRVAQARDLARELASRPFELNTPPLVRALLVRLSDTDHVLVYVMHHVVTDGVSASIFHRDLRAFYSAGLKGREAVMPVPEAHYADYVAWEQQWLATEAEQARRYWSQQLAGWRELRLPGAEGGRPTLAVDNLPWVLSPAETADVAAVARRSKATTFMVVCAAFAAILYDWSGEPDVVFGTLADNRPQARFRNVAGCFANFVPLQVTCADIMTFSQLVENVRDVVLGAYEHQHLPFAEIVQLAQAHRSFSRMPLFQVTAQWTPSDITLELPGCASDQWIVSSPVSRFELTLFAAQDGQRLALDLEYATDLWDSATIARRRAQLAGLLRRGSADPARRLGTLLGRKVKAGHS